MTTRFVPALAALFLATQPVFATDAALTSDASDPVSLWQEDPTRVFDASEIDLDAFRWIARPIVVFADTEADPRFQEQISLLKARPEALGDRDVVLIVDTAPTTASDLRRKLRPRGFMLALIGKDGNVKLRKPLPWDVREISRSIDKMPLRKREIRENPGG